MIPKAVLPENLKQVPGDRLVGTATINGYDMDVFYKLSWDTDTVPDGMYRSKVVHIPIVEVEAVYAPWDMQHKNNLVDMYGEEAESQMEALAIKENADPETGYDADTARDERDDR